MRRTRSNASLSCLPRPIWTERIGGSTGKLTRRQAMESHLRGKMSPKRRRKLSQDQPIAANDRREALRLLGMK